MVLLHSETSNCIAIIVADALTPKGYKWHPLDGICDMLALTTDSDT